MIIFAICLILLGTGILLLRVCFPNLAASLPYAAPVTLSLIAVFTTYILTQWTQEQNNRKSCFAKLYYLATELEYNYHQGGEMFKSYENTLGPDYNLIKLRSFTAETLLSDVHAMKYISTMDLSLIRAYLKKINEVNDTNDHFIAYLSSTSFVSTRGEERLKRSLKKTIIEYLAGIEALQNQIKKYNLNRHVNVEKLKEERSKIQKEIEDNIRDLFEGSSHYDYSFIKNKLAELESQRLIIRDKKDKLKKQLGGEGKIDGKTSFFQKNVTSADMRSLWGKCLNINNDILSSVLNRLHQLTEGSAVPISINPETFYAELFSDKYKEWNADILELLKTNITFVITSYWMNSTPLESFQINYLYKSNPELVITGNSSLSSSRIELLPFTDIKNMEDAIKKGSFQNRISLESYINDYIAFWKKIITVIP